VTAALASADRLDVRRGERRDAREICAIYNQGIEERIATFETEPRTEADILAWFERDLPIVAAERGGTILGYAVAFPYRARPCYSGVGEFSVYVARTARGQGVGAAVLAGLIDAVARRGYWKLLSRIFPENVASRRLCAALGFREVGIYRRHARLDGVWRDTVIVELLLGEATSDVLDRKGSS
jgi:L-amino acid N-acyltransferase YncA